MGKKPTQGHLSSIITSPPPNEPNRLSSEITLCKAFSFVSKSLRFLQPSLSFYRLSEGQGWNRGAQQDSFSHWWKGRCTRAVVTLALQQECTKLIVLAIMICIIWIIGHLRLRDFNRDNLNQKQECPLKNIFIFRNMQVQVFDAQRGIRFQQAALLWRTSNCNKKSEKEKK